VQRCGGFKEAESTDKFFFQEKIIGVKLDKKEWLTAVM